MADLVPKKNRNLAKVSGGLALPAMIDDGGLPAVLYHIPSRTGISIDVETVARTAQAGGVIGLKETGSVGWVSALRHAAPDVPIFSGDDGLTLPMISLGAVGVISVASNVVPRMVADYVHDAVEGRYEKALAAHERLHPLFESLFREPNPAPVKAALVLAGRIPQAGVRLPLVDATPPLCAELEGVLRALLPAPIPG